MFEKIINAINERLHDRSFFMTLVSFIIFFGIISMVSTKYNHLGLTPSYLLLGLSCIIIAPLITCLVFFFRKK